jgi:hypothetical protein
MEILYISPVAPPFLDFPFLLKLGLMNLNIDDWIRRCLSTTLVEKNCKNN